MDNYMRELELSTNTVFHNPRFEVKNQCLSKHEQRNDSDLQ